MSSFAVVNDVAGFTYTGNFPEVARYSSTINETTRFVNISGGAFVSLSRSVDFAPLLVHPNQADVVSASNVSHNGLSFDCLSQLDIKVANSWKGNWTANSPRESSNFE